MMKTLKPLLVFTIALLYYNAVAQIPTCSPTGNILIFSNYDGGELNINIDQNIPNLKIGVCTYEPVRITISGPFASNVSQVVYAGFNSVQNNNNCNIGNFPTSIAGVPLPNQSILTVPSVTLNNPNGYNFGIICGYSCDVNTNQGGCNTIDQIEDYFITQLGGTLFSLNAQYCCWLGSDVYQVSQLAGSCCNISNSTTTLTSAIGTNNQSVCINNAIASITYSYNNFAPTVSGLPTGVNFTTNNGIVTINGTPTTAGTFIYNLSIPGNCGGVQTTTGTIIVNDLSGATIVTSACNTYTAPWGNVYTQSGAYTDTLSALNGCDSIVSLNLTITGAIITPPLVASACSPYTAPWGTVYTQSGTYTDTLTTLNGCDSIVNVNLTITSAIIAPPITTSACSTYTAPWGTVYTQSGSYSDTLTSVNGCDSIVSVNLTITGLPTVTVSSISASCELPDGAATATATGGAGNYSYSWSNGATGNTVTGLSSGNYLVTATDQNGCFSSIQVTVLSDSLSAVSITANDSCLENNIPFSILTAETISSISWNFGDTSSGVNNTSSSLLPTHLFSSTGNYNVTANIIATCGSFQINYPLQIVQCDSIIKDCTLYVPNAFTPNDDGINDEFYPITSCAPQQYELSIFDRWGELIFKTSNLSDKWDGKYKSSGCPDGIYVYLITYKFPSEQTKNAYGSITLLR
jgi:gliding motility-associated-like protein